MWSSVVVCRDFEFFKVPRVCGPCVVVCGDFEFFQSSSVLGPCVVASAVLGLAGGAALGK